MHINMRGAFEWLLEKTLFAFGIIVLSATVAIIWTVAGLLVGVPYALLTSSYGDEAVRKFVTFGPFVIILLYFVFLVDSHATLRRGILRPMRTPQWSFFILLAWVMLPVIANMVSKIAEYFGWSEVTRVVFHHRFETLWLPVIFFCCFLIVAGIRESFVQRHEYKNKLMGEMPKSQ